ncbi:uncharacterized protein LOC135495358 [Lineus longissimus]|uniref:uncharacterized protein LOC135495358 n=1 Tax=Lineus longissimus TaxID=88925 RepID=UPI002B4D1A0A
MANTRFGSLWLLAVFFFGLVLDAACGSPIEKPIKVNIEDDGSQRPHIIHLEVNVLPGPEKEQPLYAISSDPSTEAGEGSGEPPEPNGGTESNCIMMTPQSVRGYGGCNMTEVEENCYTNPICSDTCIAEDGTIKVIGSPLWPEQNDTQMCECVRPGSIYHSPPVPPPGAREWPPSRHCRPNGCTFPGNNTLIQPGATVELNGTPCFCEAGPDPNLMDYAFLYHLKCHPTTSDEDTSASIEVTSASNEAIVVPNEAEANPASNEDTPASDQEEDTPDA